MFIKVLLILTTLLLSLIAGLFYSYSVSVNPGLKALQAKEYLSAMQSINRAILNPLFFISFMGVLALMPLCLWILYKGSGLNQAGMFMGASMLVYVVGVFGVTIFGNVPLNNALDRLDIIHTSADQLEGFRQMFESRWNAFHSIRTLANIVSLILWLLGLIR